MAGAVNLVSISADGADREPKVLASIERGAVGALVPYSWASDGSIVCFSGAGAGILSVRDGSVRKLGDSPFMERQPVVSPTGDLIAFTSNCSGTTDVWLSPYPDVSARPPVQVSRSGGADPRWARDGRELFYLESNRMMAVRVETDPELKTSEPRALFERPSFRGANGRFGQYDVAPDRRFLMAKDAGEGQREGQLVVVENWFEELKRLVPTS